MVEVVKKKKANSASASGDGAPKIKIKKKSEKAQEATAEDIGSRLEEQVAAEAEAPPLAMTGKERRKQRVREWAKAKKEAKKADKTKKAEVRVKRKTKKERRMDRNRGKRKEALASGKKPAKPKFGMKSKTKEAVEPAKDSEQESKPSAKVSKPELTVFVAGLPWHVGEEQLKSDFAECGEIARTSMPRHDDGSSKGVAFIEFKDEKGVKAALAFHGESYGGRDLQVTIAWANKPKKGEGKDGDEGSGKGNIEGEGKDESRDKGKDGGTGKAKDNGKDSGSEEEFFDQRVSKRKAPAELDSGMALNRKARRLLTKKKKPAQEDSD